MAKGNVAAEPSMEEILASIRRIIADEEPGTAKKGDFISDAMPDETDGFDGLQASNEDVLDLGAAEESAIDPIPARSVTPVDTDDLSFDGGGGSGPPTATRAPAPPPRQNEWQEAARQETMRQETMRPAYQPPQAVPPQAYTRPPQQQAYAPQPQAYPQPGGLISAHTDSAVSAAFNSLASAIFSNEPRTIEDLTKEMLRPILKQWLDDNLPSLVERIVRDEIERVARGRR